MPTAYDVERETEFSREKLRIAIPNRLQELVHVVAARRNKVEVWYADLITKILQSVHRTCRDLLNTIDQDGVAAAAWNARNLLELWIWIKYCASSQANARHFYEDALRDMQGLADSLSKLHELRGLPAQFGASTAQKIAEVASEKLGLSSIDGAFERVSDAAKAIGHEQWFSANNKLLSKFAHPTAGLVLGIMHQTEKHRHLQALLTTSGLYFAGQCVIALEEMILAMPAE